MKRRVSRGRGSPAPLPVACLVSLGCAKNTVDSERILAALVQDGFLVCASPKEADVCLVNTCGFIADARDGTRRVLAALARQRRRGKPRRIVALGCLVERAADVPAQAEGLRPADARIGFGDYLRIPALCRALLSEDAAADADLAAGGTASEKLSAFHRLPRLVTGSPHSVPLKISEGCSHGCRFCTIPRIRGPQVSRPIPEIVEEARALIASGARELCLIGQDTTSYGRDLHGRRCLPDLLRSLLALPDDVWWRVMYAYPRFVDDRLLDTMAADPRICPYLDIPLQHISDAILKRMGRGMDGAATRRLLDRIRARLPGVCLRTTFIVGHPGETEGDFAELLAFVREGHFLHAGVFRYSPETGTPSAAATDRVAEALAEERRATLMEAQRQVSRERLRAWVGRAIEVLVDAPVRRHAHADARWTARHGGQAPEVDGATYLAGRPASRLFAGQRALARVTASLDYDLVATTG